MAGKKNIGGGGGGLASKQTKMLDNYLTYDLGKNDFKVKKYMIEKRAWESQKVGKGKTPALRNFFAWHYECKKFHSCLIYFIDPRLFIHGGAVINPGDKKVKSQADTFMFDCELGLWKKFFVLE